MHENFTTGVVQVFGEEYLGKSTQVDVDCLLQVTEARDFTVMLGSIDRMHWKWKNHSLGWQSMFAKGI